ncbi:hypothetical protein VT84_09260 [Gemmata sp. SH-PL17]|nr:hypothetical protein VT84_09260 [Gemmata sp. SH-PL17]
MNENCHGCGAQIARHKCAYCGRLADLTRDRVVRDPRDDPKRNIEPRKIMR